MDPPFVGIVETTLDALILLENSRRGHLPRITRRLAEKEQGLIRSGAVFIFDRGESGIKRWTDGLIWSPSRILGNFLVYRETKKRGETGLAAPPLLSESSLGLDADIIPGSEAHAAILSWKERERERERQLVGPLTTSYKFKKGGLVKKTISVSVNGVTQHLVSYYSLEDAKSGRLRTPSTIPELVAFAISPDYLDPKHFRYPFQTEFGPDGILRYRAEAEDVSNSPPSNAPKLSASFNSHDEASSDRSRPSSRHLVTNSNPAPGPSGSKRTSPAPFRKPSLAENEASSPSASPNPDRSASLSHPFAMVAPNPNYATSYPPPPIDHFPLHDPSQSQLVSRTSSLSLVTDPSLPPHCLPQHQNQQQQPPHSLRHPHHPPYSSFSSSSSGSIPIPAPLPGRSSLSHDMDPRPASSHLRRRTQQHFSFLGGQASLHSPSLGRSLGRSSRFYHPYGNTTFSMEDASPDGVSRRSGSSDGRGGNSSHRQYGSANSLFPAPLFTGDGSWNQPRFMLPTDASSFGDPSPYSTDFPSMSYSLQSGFNSYPSRVTADHLLPQAVQGDCRSSTGGESMHGVRRGSVVGMRGGGGIDGGPLSASLDQFSYASFPFHPSPPLAYPSEPYQHHHQEKEHPSSFQQPTSHYRSGLFEERSNNSFSRPRFASSAGFLPDPRSHQQQPEFRHSLSTASVPLDNRLVSLPPHQQQQQFSYPHNESFSSSNEPYYPPYGDAPIAPSLHPPPHHPLHPFHSSFHHDLGITSVFYRPSSSSTFDPYTPFDDPYQ